ncbi:MAG TPA: hypothetical protein VM223_10005 [Planctomycetota bacterium]|nr:hypothetical protein [Planctomycetota bacterium]
MNSENDKPNAFVATGDAAAEPGGDSGSRLVVYPIGPYEVVLQFSRDDEFQGVVEVRVNTDFRSFRQKIASSGYHDVDEFYK